MWLPFPILARSRHARHPPTPASKTHPCIPNPLNTGNNRPMQAALIMASPAGAKAPARGGYGRKTTSPSVVKMSGSARKLPPIKALVGMQSPNCRVVLSASGIPRTAKATSRRIKNPTRNMPRCQAKEAVAAVATPQWHAKSQCQVIRKGHASMTTRNLMRPMYSNTSRNLSLTAGNAPTATVRLSKISAIHMITRGTTECSLSSRYTARPYRAARCAAQAVTYIATHSRRTRARSSFTGCEVSCSTWASPPMSCCVGPDMAN
mmetsp:Transcript_1784/g.3994  ORF Transcript_1784/g.3994 Transcript_1784/m.3994 type:complete len:263 (-) Transcript_1784:10-798(-)